MLVEGDTYEIPNEQELFSLKKLARAKVQRSVDINKISEPENSKDESNSENDEGSSSDDGCEKNLCIIIFFFCLLIPH